MKRVGAGAARVLYTGAKPTRPGQASRVWCGAPPRRSRLRWRVGQQGAGTGGCCVAADVAGAPNPWVGMDRAANGRLLSGPRNRGRKAVAVACAWAVACRSRETTCAAQGPESRGHKARLLDGSTAIDYALVVFLQLGINCGVGQDLPNQ
jgi:hypothetical protein